MSTPMAAMQFLSVEDNAGENELRLHEEVVDSILMSNDVADKPVVVISVAGAYRTGKSFLLDSMCRYLMASDKSHWLDNRSESFHWQCGCEAHTNGMFMSQTIPVTLMSGEKAVVLLMDSQGIFDDNSSTIDSTRIFALSTLLSSVLVYNVMNNLKTDDLVNLQLFAEYGRMAKNNTEVKPFQDLVFLIRDWHHTNNYPVGSQGGNDLVEKRLSSNKENKAQGPEPIKTCFTGVSGFLLPFPGEKVAGSPKFTGDAEDMVPAFKEALEELVSTLLSPENLTVKMNGDRPMTCRQLVTHIKTYTELFRSGKLPGAENIFEAVAEAGNMAAVNEEHNTYTKGMDGLLGQDSPLLQESRLFTQHRQAKDDARNSLKLRRTLRHPTRKENYYQSLLEEKIEDWFNAAHKKKLDRDIPEAKKANQKLVNELIDSVKKRTNMALQDPLRCVPSSEAKICDEHEQVKRETLADFNGRKLEVGSYVAEESQLRLEQALGDNLCEALKMNEIVKAAHKKKMERDISEAKSANQKLVKECIQVAQVRMKKPQWLVPISEATICNEHEKTKQELLKCFNERKVTVGSYDAEEHRKMLELVLDGYRREALEKNDTIKAAHQIVLEKSKTEARKSNQKLVEECIEIAQKSMAKDSMGIWQFLPSKDATVADEHEKAKQKALQHWSDYKVTVDSYNADDAYNADDMQQQLDEALGQHKIKALEENEEKFHKFISSIPGVAVSSGAACFAVGSAAVTGGTSVLVGVAGVAAGATVSWLCKAAWEKFAPVTKHT